MHTTAVPQAAATPAAAAPSAAEAQQALLARGLELQGRGEDAAAAAVFQQCLAADPNSPGALYSLAILALKAGDADAALALLGRGTAAVPQFAPMWGLQGTALQAAGRNEEALAAFDKALAINPQFVEVWLNSGVLLRKLLRHVEAIERFNRVLAINPEHQAAVANCAIMLTEFKRSAEAVQMFQRLLALNPEYDWGPGLLCYERLHSCDWTDFERLSAEIVQGLAAGKRSCKSLPLMAIVDDAAAHQTSARLFAAQHFPASNRPLWTGERYRHDKIRLAYVSADLREHPVGHLMAGIFEHHDRSRFELTAVSLGPDDQSRLRGRMLKAFDRFIDARLLGSRQIAERLRALEIDIAVDLGGYTADSRTEVFAARPAPVQVNYLGYPGTMGATYMDYVLADRHVIPPEHRGFYDEQVVYLPDCYLPAAGGITVAARTPGRAECGLPEQGLVFCSFNHDYKIAPPVFAAWMRLLAAVPGSVLWLMSRNEQSKHNLRKAAEAAGVAADRLVFAGRVPRVEDHLARYRLADLFLDTHPYNAHTTASDALLAGLPVLTLMGNAFPARVAGSLLHGAGLPELITRSLPEYEARALQLARHPAELAALRAKLQANAAANPLLDTAGFTRAMEAAYTAMWRRSQLGGARDALS